MKDLGLTTPALAAFKRDFYVEGLGGCIGRGTWDAGAALPYDHALLTVSSEGWLAARFVASHDASGRGQYPLVACLQSPDHACLQDGQIWPWLEQKVTEAKAAANAEQLERVFSAAPEQRRPSLVRAPDRPTWLAQFGAGWERVVHALSPEGGGHRQVRLPLGTGQDAVLWASALVCLHQASVLTLVWPAGGDWADAAFGPPSIRLLRNLFSGKDQIPLTTAVPFSIAEQTVIQSDAARAEWLAAPALFPQPEQAKERPPFLQGLSHDFRNWWNS